MFQRSRRLTAAVNLDCFSSITSLKSERFRKSRAIFSTRPVTHDVKSTSAVYLSAFGFLGVSLALFYWSRKKSISPPLSLPVVEATSESPRNDVPKSTDHETVEKVLPAVVHIENKQMKWMSDERRLQLTPVSSGSGFIVDERGFILTSGDVIANARYISVRLYSGETFKATLIDFDEVTNLALIKLKQKVDNTRYFPTLKFGKSTELQLGEIVIAFNNLDDTISWIVSKVSHTSKELGFDRGAEMDYIQTDASIMENSGGPLINFKGEVVGINTMTTFPEVSFAVSSQVAEEFISNACKISNEQNDKKYVMGVSMMSLSPQILYSIQQRVCDMPTDVQKGVLLASVWPDHPACRYGLQVNDIIVRIDEMPITSSSQVYDMLQTGELLNIEVVRGQRKIICTVIPEKFWLLSYITR